MAPGQGFFIKTGTGVTELVFKESLRSVERTGGVFNRGVFGEESSIKLLVSSKGVQVSTTIAYRSNASLGLDPGYDLGNFEGADLDVYTHLVKEGKGKDFTYQSLPKEMKKNQTIPVGVKID